MSVEVIGIDHIYIAVSDLARSAIFYDQVMAILGFRKNQFEIHGAPHIQYYNRHFGYVLRPAHTGTPRHDPYQAGLHHLCFRVDGIAELQTISALLTEATIPHEQPKGYPLYAEDYHAIFLTDPDGIRLEITNYRQERRDRAEQWDDLPD